MLQSSSAHPKGIAVVAADLRAETAHEAAQATRQLYERLAHGSAGEHEQQRGSDDEADEEL